MEGDSSKPEENELLTLVKRAIKRSKDFNPE